MPDLREDFIDVVSRGLIEVIENKNLLSDVIDVITISLNDYDVTEKCTELVVSEQSNEMIVKKYCACLLIDGRSKNTIYQYAREVRRFYYFIGKNLTDIGTYDIRMYLAFYKQKGLCNRSLATMRSYLYAFFEWMSEEEIIEKNPCSRIKPIKYNSEIKKPFTDVEIDAIRYACRDNRERALVEFLLASGVRRSELCDIKVGDINFADLSVHIRNGKGGKSRITYINDLSLRYITAYLDERGCKDADERLFHTERGDMSRSGLRFVLDGLSKRSGVENVHPHRFRRTFATSLTNRGMDVQEVQKLLGHANINTTMRYVCVDDDRIKLSYKKHSQSI